MDHFTYRKGALCAEDVPLKQIAAEIGTPFYCYSTATILRHFDLFTQAFGDMDALVCYALKANSNQAVIRTLALAGAGADVVSAGEIRRAIAAGVPADKIVFSGMGKTRDEIAYALDTGIYQFNVESEAELRILSEIATAKGKVAPVAVRITPDVDGKTHAKITTGTKISKFGIDLDQAQEFYRLAATLPSIQIVGVSTHIGSQITDIAPFKQAFTRIVALVKTLRADGHKITRLDLGGGLGIPYHQENPATPASYAAMVKEVTRGIDCRLTFEPGRLIVGNAGILVSAVITTKKTPAREFLVVDAGMNDLMRPTLYDAYHEIVAVSQPASDARIPMDVVGPVCETGDVFARQRPMPPLASGDLIALRTAGAYGAVMSGTYNTRGLIPEVLVKGREYAVIRPRQTVEELIALDTIPGWLASEKT